LKIKQAMPHVKISGGETMMTRFEFKEWVDRGAYDIVQPDCNTTGLSEARHIAEMAHLREKLCCPHSWHGAVTLVANATLAASIPNLLMLEMNQTFNPLRDELFKEPLVVKNGYLDFPDKPGFGVELIDNVAQRFPYLPGRYNKPNPDLPS
jgi:galactonate dehydratase